MMNRKAQELGLSNTHFVTPHGLDNDEHYTTAYELAGLADYALNNKKIAEVVNTKNYTVYINGYGKKISNTNELLGYLEGVNGVKTGFTNNAGRCLVTSVNRKDFQIITVVLGADTKRIRTNDSIKLIKYAYTNYELINIKEIIENKFKEWQEVNKVYIDKGKKENIKIKLAENAYEFYPVNKNKENSIDIQISANTMLEAPVYADMVIGKLIIKFDDEVIGEIEIRTNENVEKRTVEDYLSEIFKNYKKLYCMSI